MRYLSAVAAGALVAVLTTGCCDRQYQAPYVQPAQTSYVQPGQVPYVQSAQPVYCVPQAQVQPQVVCPPGTVPVRCP